MTDALARLKNDAPSVRLLGAAACATPVISDRWDGLDQLLVPDKEIILAETSATARRSWSATLNKPLRVHQAAGTHNPGVSFEK